MRWGVDCEVGNTNVKLLPAQPPPTLFTHLHCFDQVTGFGYDHGEAWKINMDLWQQLTIATKQNERPRGLRRLGAASVDLCHVACGGCRGWGLRL